MVKVGLEGFCDNYGGDCGECEELWGKFGIPECFEIGGPLNSMWDKKKVGRVVTDIMSDVLRESEGLTKHERAARVFSVGVLFFREFNMWTDRLRKEVPRCR